MQKLCIDCRRQGTLSCAACEDSEEWDSIPKESKSTMNYETALKVIENDPPEILAERIVELYKVIGEYELAIKNIYNIAEDISESMNI